MATYADDVRCIGYAIGALTMSGADEASVPAEVTVKPEAVDPFDAELQDIADDLDDWAINLHDRFRDLAMAFIELGRYLDYEVTAKRPPGHNQ